MDIPPIGELNHTSQRRHGALLLIGTGLLAVIVFSGLVYLGIRTQTASQPRLLSEQNLATSDLFTKLTHNTWCNKRETSGSTGGFAPTSRKYEFRDDGTYAWSHFSDYNEGGGKGNWYFQQTTVGGGIIFLDSGDVVRFSLNSDSTLSFEKIKLDACDPLPVTGTYTADTLPKIAPSAMFIQLTAHDWYKGDDFDLYRLPTKVQLQANGEYTAEYNNGQCSYRGFWSWRYGSIIRQIPSDNCDPRTQGETSYHSYTVTMESTSMVFEGAMYTATPNTTAALTRSTFGYTDKVQMTLTYTRPLRAETKNTLTVELKNVSASDNLTFSRFVITEQQYDQIKNGFSPKGASHTLVDKQLQRTFASGFEPLVLTPGQSFSFPADITFTGSGDTGVKFDVPFEGHTQVYKGREYYILKL